MPRYEAVERFVKDGFLDRFLDTRSGSGTTSGV